MSKKEKVNFKRFDWKELYSLSGTTTTKKKTKYIEFDLGTFENGEFHFNEDFENDFSIVEDDDFDMDEYE